ncbi:hypothetical protein CBER1_10031 [Cercospora berteroae]|uniref:Uncharacterized protein n=1 Tax=Cercospora berteroae TaxID=357750 RepID=A0A2S6BX81_9PEZI|nr:hypothetical protein CBER1_10031 [Cercospora berteroae]
MARKTLGKKAQRDSKSISRVRTRGAGPNEALPDGASPGHTSPGNTAPDNAAPGDGIAATKVFGITELLERILLFTTSTHSKDTVKHSSDVMQHLNPDGQISFSRLRLFAMQGVSKDFCGTIRGSAQLKRIMFLLPYKNEHLETLAASHLIPTLPYHEPDLDSDSTAEGPILTVKLLGGNLTEEGNHFQLAFDEKVPNGWLNPEASWKDIKICNAAKAIPLTVKIVHNSWVIGRVNLSWLLQGDETLGYLFELFRQIFQQLDGWEAATVEIEEKREGLDDEKGDTEEEWREELKQARKAGTEKEHRAIVEEQRALWITRENEIDEEEKQANRKWDDWTRAVWIEQNNRRLAFESAKKL